MMQRFIKEAFEALNNCRSFGMKREQSFYVSHINEKC